MSGLLENPMNAAPQGTPPAPATSPSTLPAGVPPASGDTTPAASPEDQKAIDAMVANGIKLIHNQKLADLIISQVADAKYPVQPIVTITLNIVERLEQSAKAAGKALSLTVVAYGANYIMGEIILVAEKAGMTKLDDATKYRAFSLAVGKYIEAALKSGKMTKAQVMQLGKDAQGTDIGQKIMGMAGGETTETPPMAGEMPNGAPIAETPVKTPGGKGGQNVGAA